MKYDPINKHLYTDNGILIKRLHCPLKIKWNELEYNSLDHKNKFCIHCDKSIIDTSQESDKKIYSMVQRNPNLCLKIDLNNKNMKYISGVKNEK